MSASTPRVEETADGRLGGPAMFDRIATRYDRMNRLMSLGLDRSWRRRLVKAMGPLGVGDRALDVATGIWAEKNDPPAFYATAES